MNDKQIRMAVHQKLFRRYSAAPNTLILVLRDAVEVPVGAEENLTVGNSWRRVARLAQVIHGQKFELLRIWPKNGGDASSARDIQPPGCHHDRTPAFSAVEPLGPPDFSGLAFHTLSGPWSGLSFQNIGQVSIPAQDSHDFQWRGFRLINNRVAVNRPEPEGSFR